MNKRNYIKGQFENLKQSKEFKSQIKLWGGKDGETHRMGIDNRTVSLIEKVLLNPMAYQRMTVLLQATKDLLDNQRNSCYNLNILEETAIWDEVECDGDCLLDEVTELMEDLS